MDKYRAAKSLISRDVLKNAFFLRYSTAAAAATPIDDVGFGFTAQELAESKPYEEIPSPKKYPIFGHFFCIKPFGDLDIFNRISFGNELQKKYGDIVTLSFPLLPGAENNVVLLDPSDFEIVYRNEGRFPARPTSPILLKYREERKHSLGLFLANGEEWWKFRQPLNPGMMKVKAATTYLQFHDGIGDDLVKNIKNEITGNDKQPVIMQELFRYSLEAVCAIVFDNRLGCMDPNLAPNSWQQQFIDSVHSSFDTSFSLALNPVYRLHDKFGYKGKKQLKFEESMDYITDTSLRLVHEAKQRWEGIPETELHNKFLAQLLNIERIVVEEKMSVIFDMLFAAIDTTTYTVLNNLFFLAKNPDAQEKLFSEIDKHISKDKGVIDASIFPKLHYLRACVKESFRMKPIAPVITRNLSKDIVIKGYRIPAGMTLLMEHHFTSNNENHIDNPTQYKPERWIRDSNSKNSLNPFLVLPFGFGPRMCIGKRFAEQEINIALIKLLHNFRIEYDGDALPLKGIGVDKVPVKLDFRFVER